MTKNIVVYRCTGVWLQLYGYLIFIGTDFYDLILRCLLSFWPHFQTSHSLSKILPCALYFQLSSGRTPGVKVSVRLLHTCLLILVLVLLHSKIMMAIPQWCWTLAEKKTTNRLLLCLEEKAVKVLNAYCKVKIDPTVDTWYLKLSRKIEKGSIYWSLGYHELRANNWNSVGCMPINTVYILMKFNHREVLWKWKGCHCVSQSII